MKLRYCLPLVAFSLLAVPTAHAQIVNGVMTVTGAEMHWWAGVACDATARLYDVDEDSVVFKRLDKTSRYDQGTVTFRARKGALIDLDKLHESIWATRLSGGTRSGIVSLEVTVIGELHTSSQQTVLKVSGSNAEFILKQPSGEQYVGTVRPPSVSSGNGTVVRVKGLIENYVGRWPNLLKTQPIKPRGILVTAIEVEE